MDTVRRMAVEFLTDEQAEAYGKFTEEPTRPELERFFFLDEVDRDLIALRRTQRHQPPAGLRPLRDLDAVGLDDDDEGDDAAD